MILVTGGAGYIGTNVVNVLLENGNSVVVVDDFSNSKEKHIKKLLLKYPGQIEVCSFDFGDYQKLRDVFLTHKIDGVIHLAGKKYVKEGEENPELYNKVNVGSTQTLLKVMNEMKVKKIVFASTAMVYGNGEQVPFREYSKLAPASVYAKTKCLGEKQIEDFAKQGGSGVVLRLSNPVGANLNMMLGDDNTAKEKPLLPYLIDSALSGKEIVLNGCDHNTPDGTPIRDFVYVCDVAKAFVIALGNAQKGLKIFNIGAGQNGKTILEVVHEVEKSTGKKLSCSFGPKRNGDVSVLVLDNEKAKRELGVSFSADFSKVVDSQFKFGMCLKQLMKK